MRTWIGSCVAGVLVAGMVTACGGGATSSSGSGSGSRSGSSSSASSALQSDYISTVDAVLPSVVQITTSSASGSGVVYDDKGDIVTNAHVVGTATSMKVTPAAGGQALQANVVSVYTPDDLAVIRVTSGAGKLKPASFGDSGKVQTGEIVLAMGNPLGLTGSVTQGIVSATGRTISEASAAGESGTTMANAIQTSAPINSGNSGGALVNLDHQVIGIPTAAARDPEAGAAPGIGFAIPSDTVKDIADQIIKSGRVTNSGRAALEITARSVANDQGHPDGVGIVDVTSGGAADKAGLRAGDVITAVNGTSTPSLPALDGLLAKLKPGDSVEVTYVRDGATKRASVTLGNLSG
jgi:putative serine protease PepD